MNPVEILRQGLIRASPNVSPREHPLGLAVFVTFGLVPRRTRRLGKPCEQLPSSEVALTVRETDSDGCLPHHSTASSSSFALALSSSCIPHAARMRLSPLTPRERRQGRCRDLESRPRPSPLSNPQTDAAKAPFGHRRTTKPRPLPMASQSRGGKERGGPDAVVLADATSCEPHPPCPEPGAMPGAGSADPMAAYVLSIVRLRTLPPNPAVPQRPQRLHRRVHIPGSDPGRDRGCKVAIAKSGPVSGRGRTETIVPPEIRIRLKIAQIIRLRF